VAVTYPPGIVAEDEKDEIDSSLVTGGNSVAVTYPPGAVADDDSAASLVIGGKSVAVAYPPGIVAETELEVVDPAVSDETVDDVAAVDAVPPLVSDDEEKDS
jgi:hypothetical protein